MTDCDPTVADFLLPSVENTKNIWHIFDIWMTITLGVNMINTLMTPFDSSTFDLYPLVYFIFAFRDLQIEFHWVSPFA